MSSNGGEFHVTSKDVDVTVTVSCSGGATGAVHYIKTTSTIKIQISNILRSGSVSRVKAEL